MNAQFQASSGDAAPVVGPPQIGDFAAVAALFRQAFPKHPVSRLPLPVALDFFASHARDSHFFVARGNRGEVLGFAIGGEAAQLDACRRAFIRAHVLDLLTASLNDRSFFRALRVRMFSPFKRPDAAASPYQLRFIAVDPAARRLGAGIALLRHFEAALPPQSCYHAWTLAGPNGATAFYEACGFTRDCVVDGQVRMQKILRAAGEGSPHGND